MNSESAEDIYVNRGLKELYDGENEILGALPDPAGWPVTHSEWSIYQRWRKAAGGAKPGSPKRKQKPKRRTA